MAKQQVEGEGKAANESDPAFTSKFLGYLGHGKILLSSEGDRFPFKVCRILFHSMTL